MLVCVGACTPLDTPLSRNEVPTKGRSVSLSLEQRYRGSLQMCVTWVCYIPKGWPLDWDHTGVLYTRTCYTEVFTFVTGVLYICLTECLTEVLQGCLTGVLQGCFTYVLQGALQGCYRGALLGCFTYVLQGALQGCYRGALHMSYRVPYRGALHVSYRVPYRGALQGCSGHDKFTTDVVAQWATNPLNIVA